MKAKPPDADNVTDLGQHRRRKPHAEAAGGTRPEAKVNGRAPQPSIDELNRDYFVALQGGNAAIVRVEHDPVLKRDRHVFMSADAFRLFHNNRRVCVGTDKDGEPTYKPLGSSWLTSAERRTYRRMVLAPGQSLPANSYNLWRGWGVPPKPGSWTTIRAHWLDVICSGDQTLFAYLERWAATCVQYPERRPEVAFAMRGGKGAGKGMGAMPLVRIFGAHAVQVFNPKHLTGAFNAHLLDALLVFVDEAFWAGDKVGEGVLKGQITEPVVMIERKGADAYQAPNMLKLILSANAAWVVPASADERRYFVLDVPNTKVGNRAYFAALLAAIEGAETSALLHHLLHLDLAGFEIRDVPQTKGLADQKLIGGTSVEKWWRMCLDRGKILADDKGWEHCVKKQLSWQGYIEWCRMIGEKHPVTDALLTKELTVLCYGTNFRTSRPTIGDRRWTCYLFGDLTSHREAFAKAMKIDPSHIKWD